MDGPWRPSDLPLRPHMARQGTRLADWQHYCGLVVKLGRGTLMFVRDRWLWTALGSGLVGVAAVTVAWEVMPPISECLNSGVDGVACGAAQTFAGLFFAFPAALLAALLGAKLLRLRQWWQVGASATFLTAVLTTVTHIDTWRALAVLGAGVFFLAAVAFDRLRA